MQGLKRRGRRGLREGGTTHEHTIGGGIMTVMKRMITENVVITITDTGGGIGGTRIKNQKKVEKLKTLLKTKNIFALINFRKCILYLSL